MKGAAQVELQALNCNLTTLATACLNQDQNNSCSEHQKLLKDFDNHLIHKSIK